MPFLADCLKGCGEHARLAPKPPVAEPAMPPRPFGPPLDWFDVIELTALD